MLRPDSESNLDVESSRLRSFSRRYQHSELENGFNTFQVDTPKDQEAGSPNESELLAGLASPSLSFYLAGNADPFDATPVPVTSWTYGILVYIRPFTLLTVWPVEMENSRTKSFVSSAHKSIYKAFVSHSSIQHAMLAYSWSVMSMLRPHEKDECYFKVTQHVLRSMRALRPIVASLSHETDLHSLICALQTVQTLTSAEIYRGNRGAADRHRSALAVIIGLIGECKNIPWILRSAISFLIVRVAANTGTRTDVDPSYWDPGPWFTQDTPLERTNSHSRALEELTTPASKTDSPIPEFFANLREVVAVKELHNRSSETTCEDDFLAKMQWAHSRRMAIRGRVGNYWVDITEACEAVVPHQSTMSIPVTVRYANVDMCLCLALQIFISYRLESPMVKRQHWVPSGQIHHLMLLRCVRKLGFELETVDIHAPCARDLLWVCAVGVQVEHEYALWKRTAKSMPTWWARLDPDEFDVRWFSIRFSVFARRLGFASFSDIADVLVKEYVYVPEAYDVALRRAFELL